MPERRRKLGFIQPGRETLDMQEEALREMEAMRERMSELFRDYFKADSAPEAAGFSYRVSNGKDKKAASAPTDVQGAHNGNKD
ncbi:MAG: hypothetical protein Q9M30_06250 [Mariprofundaceae bacterium]|nr:hypothetical protein [Mariprofundaceae bacterium]